MIDIIWNITLICPWDCEFCCTDASNVKVEKNNIIISDNSLTNINYVRDEAKALFTGQYPNIIPNIYDLALVEKQLAGKEPTLQEKLNILDNLPNSDVKIDFAGGDPLSCYENYIFIQEASKKLGRENISITSTGHSITRFGINNISKIIGEFEFTYDEPKNNTECRPRGYNQSNLSIAKKFAELGVKTKAQIPIHRGNIDLNIIENIYRDLDLANINEILLMRTFPVGRGTAFIDGNEIDKESLVKSIDKYLLLSEVGEVSIRLQCALKHLNTNKTSDSINPCDVMHSSFGINFQGKLLLSAWANNNHGEPLSDDFILGDLKAESFTYISETPKFKAIKKRLDENSGHCKIFSFQYGNKDFDSLFTKTDPLYITT